MVEIALRDTSIVVYTDIDLCDWIIAYSNSIKCVSIGVSWFDIQFEPNAFTLILDYNIIVISLKYYHVKKHMYNMYSLFYIRMMLNIEDKFAECYTKVSIAYLFHSVESY